MPILHKRQGGPGYYITADHQGEFSTFRLSAEGEQFVTMLLNLKDGDEVRTKDLMLLLDREWARADAPPPPVAPPEPVQPPAPPKPANPPATRKPDPARQASTRRTRGREVGLQVLYQMEQNAGMTPQDVERFIGRRLRDEKLQVFARALVAGVREHQARIDDLISGAAENWRIDRMAAIDRNILRLGAYEMLFDPGVPTKVAINEALELAKRYSTSQSSRFVNGILDRLQNADPATPADPPAPVVEPPPAAEPPARED